MKDIDWYNDPAYSDSPGNMYHNHFKYTVPKACQCECCLRRYRINSIPSKRKMILAKRESDKQFNKSMTELDELILQTKNNSSLMLNLATMSVATLFIGSIIFLIFSITR